MLGGCSAIRVVYNQADHVAAWRADDYFDFNDEQKRMFHDRFERLHAWHRATQLKAYVTFLQAVEGRLTRGPAMADVAWARDVFKERTDALVQRAYQDAAAILATLSDQQIVSARRRFERDNRKFAKERGVGASVDEQKRLRAKRDLETVEHWSGPLDSTQKARFTALDGALPLDAELRYRDRLRRQREFLALLENRKDGEQFVASLRQWLLDWNASRPQTLDIELSRYSDARAAMFMTLFGDLRPEQRRHVFERLRWYRDTMVELAQDLPH